MARGTRRKIKHLYKPGVYTGFKKYDLPLLMTYSRSGTNWIRYFAETVSGIATPGHARVIEGNEYLFDRAHAGFKVARYYNRLILVLRDYKECLVRQHSIEKIKSFQSLEKFILDESLTQPPVWYMLNIQAFDAHPGQKLLIYYDDLLLNPSEPFKKLAAFLDLDVDKVENFLSELDTHRKLSVSYYRRNNESVTAGNVDKTNFYKETQLNQEQISVFDAFYKSRYPELFQRYLKRFKE